uniref:Uncharacterized protein n=1 Tax=Oryza punctata TaxID=4537 RepID=A0A0E0MM57_ORYPU
MKGALKPVACFFPGLSPFVVAACRRKMATLDGLVRGRGDSFFSPILSLSNPTMWMGLRRAGCRDSTLMAGRQRRGGCVEKRISWTIDLYFFPLY